MIIQVNNLQKQFELYQEEYEAKALQVLRSGWYVLGKEVENFEKDFANYIGSKYCVGLASGLDALWIALRVLGIGQGDEVIVQSNAYVATVMAITMNGAIPVYIEPNEYHNIDEDNLERLITKKTKAIIVTHLYGQATKMDIIKKICDEKKIYIVEDCAQSHGAKFNDKTTGTFGIIGCFSFYPTKNLGAFGDSGAIVTDDTQLNEKIRIFRNYGSEKRYYNQVVGTNSRLDEMQAGLLSVKLSHLDELNSERERIANFYLNNICNDYIKLPKVCEDCTTVWHQFVVESDYRDELIEYLKEREIQTIVHYPIPPFMQECFGANNYCNGTYPIAERKAKQVLSLPMYNGLTNYEQEIVVNAINDFKPILK